VVQHVVNFVRHTLNGRDAHIFNALATMQIPHAHDTTPKSATRGQPTRVLKGLLRDFLSETGPCQGVCEGEHGNGEEHAKPKQQCRLACQAGAGCVEPEGRPPYKFAEGKSLLTRFSSMPPRSTT